jgi:hypothetical protein
MIRPSQGRSPGSTPGRCTFIPYNLKTIKTKARHGSKKRVKKVL